MFAYDNFNSLSTSCFNCIERHNSCILNYYELIILHKGINVDISDMEIFRAVVKNGGIVRAAESLHRVPSNVTTRIRQLEDDVGVQLFLREGNRLKISPAGEVLLSYTERILNLTSEAREALHNSAPHGRLSIGAMNSTAAVRLPAPLAEYHKRFPQVKLEIRPGNTRTLMAEVLSGELETALVADPVPDARLAMEKLFTDELVIVAALAHPKISSPNDCAGETLLVFGAGCAYRNRLEDWFSDNRVFPDRIVEIASYHAMLGCVVAGMGIALLPRSVLESLPARSQVGTHKLPRKWSLSTTFLIWRQELKSSRVNELRRMLRTNSN